MRKRASQSDKSEFLTVMEFIGLRNLAIIGVFGSLYFLSGLGNMSAGRGIVDAFSPYYALHINDGGRILSRMARASSDWFKSLWSSFTDLMSQMVNSARDYFFANIMPVFQEHPLVGSIVFGTIGFILFIVCFIFAIVIVKRIFTLLLFGSVSLPGVKKERHEDIWSFDPRKKPSEEQLKIMHKNLERLVQRAPAMGGNVPKNADLSIRELAQRNQNSEFNYRCAVYVMGPVKGTSFDNQYETPLALDQVKKVSGMMGQSAIYETLPIDLVILRSKKGTTAWEVEPTTAAVNLGKSYPIKVLERVMLQNRNYFMWDTRANKSKTGYGVR